MSVSSASCPYCAALAARELDEAGVVRMPMAVLPSELCPSCQEFHFQWTGRRTDVEELEAVLDVMREFPHPGAEVVIRHVRAKLAHLKSN